MFGTKSKSDRLFLSECLQLYKDLPALWQVKSKAYKDRNKKNAAYHILVKKFNEKYPDVTKDDVKRKLNSLRTNFRKELMKIKRLQKSGIGSDEFYQPTLWYFGEMLFLVDQESEETPSELWSSRSIEGDEEKEDINETVETSLGDASTSTKSFTPTPAKMRVKIDQQEELLTLACKRLHDTDNEYAKIASVWADELRKMSPTQMLFAKKAINDILFEGQMGTLHRHSIIINTPESAPLMDSSDQ